MIKNQLKFAVLFLIAGIFFIACQKEELKPNEELGDFEKQGVENQTSASKMKSKNGILIFENKQALIDKLTELSKKDDNSIEVWEAENGFTSLASILRKSNEENNNLCKSYEKQYGIEEAVNLVNKGKISKYSNYTLMQLKKGTLKIVNSNDGTEYIELNTDAPFYANVLNLKSEMIVNDTIYKYEIGKLKLITNGDVSKLASIESINETDKKNNIIVAKCQDIEKTSQSATLDARTTTTNWRRLLADLNARRWFSGSYSETEYWMTVRCQLKHWLYGWDFSPMQVSMHGNCRWKQKQANGSTSEFFFSFYDSCYISSTNPIMSAPGGGITYSGHPYDPSIGYMLIVAQGGGETLLVELSHSTGLGYW